ncbi:DUF3991 and TOPRIM domain-containing protein [Rubinisphaera margarita]|uniref:DUF3991 and TOPRIM domain-containing protein n=1 Tax=Rubinisphaera margarita TaxID=2909586 RepID=UPI001EE8AA74|nr:DUF3991 and TOPRIM domain-containing protein [Rubinisphaera margarita]MCG6157632.1 DUF3991 and toprim domain-containing protein [Rubinisphaera margarita]
MTSRSTELEDMKRIDLCQYVASRGFVLDRRQSSRSSVVMRHANGDKLIIAKSPNGQYVYFNAKGSDNGTIIDFIQSRDRVSLGEVRKLLRPWLTSGGSFPTDLPTLPITLQPSQHDAAQVLANWLKARPLGRSNHYLEQEREIPAAVLHHAVFRDRIRIDDRSNILFPHFNAAGLCGFEIKNLGWTGFSPGGIKGLACSRPRPDDHTMVICETAIDLLSYAAIKGIEGHRFFSTAGQISPLQGECLRSAARKMPEKSVIVLAFDNDAGGHRLAEQVQEALGSAERMLITDFPGPVGADWNDVLRGQAFPRHKLPEPRTSPSF